MWMVTEIELFVRMWSNFRILQEKKLKIKGRATSLNDPFLVYIVLKRNYIYIYIYIYI